MAIITPYDNKIAIWHHVGQYVNYKSIDELAQAVRRYAPAVSQIFVKTSDGSDWMSRYDSKAALAISGPDAIRKWVLTLQKYGLEFHAWCVPRGLDIEGESRVITQACQVPGVRSMILDVEPYQGFYQGGRDSVRPLMARVRAPLPGAYHIGIAVDPRPGHYGEIFPDEWFPYVNSVHLQLYWAEFQRNVDDVLAEGFKTWQNYQRPSFAILQGYNTTTQNVTRAHQLATATYKSPGVSWYVLSEINTTAEFGAINRDMSGNVPTTPPGFDGTTPAYGASVIVQPGGAGYIDGLYEKPEPGTGAFTLYTGYNNGTGKSTLTNDHVANVYARWDPQIKQSGWYTIEVFVPNLRATTGRARYKLHGVRDEKTEVILSVPQALYNNEWAMLGTFYLDTTLREVGVIYLNDWTFEPKLEIAFDAIRWRPVITSGAGGGTVSFPYITNILARAREIYQSGQKLGNRPNVFSRVGDSISASPYFLTPIGNGQANLGSYQSALGSTMQYFLGGQARGSNPFSNASLAAGNGWGADRIILPGGAYTDVCKNDLPLVCEYNNVKPSIALIMIGTNDSGGVAPEIYTANLRRIIETSIQMGVVPVVSTIPPKRLTTWDTSRVTEWNNIIRSLATQYQIPLWDYWAALQSLPNLGIGSDGVHPSVPPDQMTANFSTENLKYGYTMRNLTALQALTAVRSALA